MAKGVQVFEQATAPSATQHPQVGDIWVKPGAPDLVYICAQASPGILFVQAGTSGGGAVNSILAGDAIGVDTPIGDVTVSASPLVGSGVDHQAGYAPDPGASAGTTKFLREDATWQVPAGGISSPLDLPDCALWLDASDAATINTGSPVDGDPVSSWADKSGNDYDAAQATADNRPVYKAALQNGLGLIRFDATSFPQHLALSGAGLGLFRNLSQATIATVQVPYAVDGTPNPIAAISAGVVIGSNPIVEFIAHSSDVVLFMYDPGFSDALAPSINRQPAMNHRAAYTGLLSANMVQGSSGGITTMPESTGTAEDNNTEDHTADVDATGLIIGGVYNLSNTMTGDICELIVYQRALSPMEQRQLYEYLSSKWGTP